MLRSVLERYKQSLLDMRPRLTDEIQRSIEAVREEVHVPGEDTQAPSEGLEKELAVERSQESLLNAINAALDRIEDGTFGQCVDCGAEIPQDRLEAVPHTPYCIGCERKRDVT